MPQKIIGTGPCPIAFNATNLVVIYRSGPDPLGSRYGRISLQTFKHIKIERPSNQI